MVKLAWVCDACGWLQVSDSKLRHCMDSCQCGKCAVDLEESYARWVGKPRVIAKKEDDGVWKHVRKHKKL